MRRSSIAIWFAVCVGLTAAHPLQADVRSEQKTRFQLAGPLGSVVNFFGGRAAREGVVSTTSVKGNRMMTTTGDVSGQLVDLDEEKVYDLDLKKKSYKVTSFADLRRQMEEARTRAQAEASKNSGAAKGQESEVDIDLDVKNTGESKTINGFSTSNAIMVITVREKGKTLQQAGGLVLTSNMWMTPATPAMKEVTEFHLRYAQKLYGPSLDGASPRDLAAAIAMYPGLKVALEKMSAEVGKLQGTPVQTTTTVETVKSAEQVAAEERSAGEARSGDSSAPPTSVGRLLGGLGRRVGNRAKDDQPAATTAKDRTALMTLNSEVMSVTGTVSAADVSIPAQFKLDK